MADEKPKTVSTELDVLTSSGAPLVFISHDSRDADFAEAFSKLLKSVSAGMIKTFRSSDKKAGDGIDFGEEWYKRLMAMLDSTSDVVCLFTERSLDRPWILFEAGVAKGKLATPVVGVAIGIPLSRITAGPFYQFQNMDSSEADLTKLVNQLARRVPGLELDADVVKVQVAAYKTTEAELLKPLQGPAAKAESEEQVEESAVAKLVEEMKALPARVAERLGDFDEAGMRRRRNRRVHPGMLEEVMFRNDPGEPLGILMAASMFRDEAPWLYEVAMDTYRAIKSGDRARMKAELGRIRRVCEYPMGRWVEEFGGGSREMSMVFRDFPHMLEHVLRQTLAETKVAGPKKRLPTAASEKA